MATGPGTGTATSLVAGAVRAARWRLLPLLGLCYLLNYVDRVNVGFASVTMRPDLGLSVKVPDQIDIQKAREVLDELRRRLGDPSRPMFELDYLERLIRPY